MVITWRRRLALQWRWIGAGGISRDEACDLRFEPIPDGTRIALRHTGPWADDAPAESYRQGWEFTLAALRRLLTQDEGAEPLG